MRGLRIPAGDEGDATQFGALAEQFVDDLRRLLAAVE
jgi:hypothetical protein